MSTDGKSRSKRNGHARDENLATSLLDSANQIWLAGLGAYSWVGEETRKTFDDLGHRGEKFEKDEKNVVTKTIDDATTKAKDFGTKAKDFGTKVEDTVHDTVTTVLHRAGVPSRDEIRTLIERVEELNKKVEKLHTN